MSIEEDAAAYQQSKIAADAAMYDKQQGPPPGTSELTKPVGEVSESQFKPASEVPGAVPKQIPGFLDIVRNIASGGAEATTRYGAVLMNSLSKIVPKDNSIVSPTIGGKTYSPDTSELPLTKAYNYLKDYNKGQADKYAGAGVLQKIGEAPVDIAATAPLGGPLGTVGKLSEAAASGIKSGLLSTGTKYGLNSLGSAPILAGAAGINLDPNNPNQMYDINKAAAAMKQPATYIAPAFGMYLGNKAAQWTNNAEALAAAKEMVPGAVNRNITPPGAMTSLKNYMFDGVPNIVSMSKSIATQEGIGPVLSDYINKLSGNLVASSAADYKAIAGRQIQKTLNASQNEVNNAWSVVPKEAPIKTGMSDINDVVTQADNLLKNMSSFPDSNLTRQLLRQKMGGSKDLDSPLNLNGQPNLTIGDVKEMASNLGNMANNAYKVPGGSQTGDMLSELRSKLVNVNLSNLSPADRQAYNTATELSANHFKTLELSSKIQDAVNSEVDARNFAKSMMSEAEPFDKRQVIGLAGETGQKALVASKLMQYLENAGLNSPDGVNIKSLVTNIRNSEALPQLADTPTLNAIDGLNNVLSGVYKSAKSTIPGAKSAISAGLAAGYYSGALTNPVTAGIAGAATVGYGVLSWIANNSPLKSALAKLSQYAPETSNSVKDYLANKVTNAMTRAGFFVNENGTLDKKDIKK